MFSKNFKVKSYRMEDGIFYFEHQKVADKSATPVFQVDDEQVFVFRIKDQPNYPFIVLTNAQGCIRVFRCFKADVKATSVEFSSIDGVKGSIGVTDNKSLSITIN